jgi:hypothetical protein
MKDATDSNNGEDAPPSFPGAFESCRAKESGFRVNVTLCLTKPPIPCHHRMISGENYICHHPNQKAIIAQTQGGKKSGAPVSEPQQGAVPLPEHKENASPKSEQKEMSRYEM